MKIVTFKLGEQRKVGIVDDGAATVRPFKLSSDQAQQGIQHLIELQLTDGELPATASPVPLDDLVLVAPLPRPRRNIFCVGKNYYDHAREFSSSGFDSSATQVPAVR